MYQAQNSIASCGIEKILTWTFSEKEKLEHMRKSGASQYQLQAESDSLTERLLRRLDRYVGKRRRRMFELPNSYYYMHYFPNYEHFNYAITVLFDWLQFSPHTDLKAQTESKLLIRSMLSEADRKLMDLDGIDSQNIFRPRIYEATSLQVSAMMRARKALEIEFCVMSDFDDHTYLFPLNLISRGARELLDLWINS